MSAAPTLALTMGDAAGIGGEILAQAFRSAPELTRGCFVAGDLAHLRRACAAATPAGGIPLPIAEIEQPAQVHALPPGCLPLLQVGPAAGQLVPWGQVDARAGRMAHDAVSWAARAALAGQVDAVVTAPLNKEALSRAGFEEPGHTELLAQEAAAHRGHPVPVRMMLASHELRTVLVSIHVSLREAIEAVTQANVVQTLQITHEALARALGRPPRIAVAGLNPHAGEGGLFGREEQEAIAPAVQAAQAQGIQASGPWPPDTIFMRARGLREFDVVVAMYHDQGLIPVKYLGLEHGVNVTLGLPFVRTSPDHGTAFDIAGTGRADPASLLEAIRVARSMLEA
ncbi:4-hydroxythreonine-4-phosphate dehydrogenase PdxA [Ramlibacter rhizophilus]|uniref:4-hydroxythreonine-4-phosphate dehydrogenase PdxA n=1 Tax=Ramlibacter rhizophilus TaxID=1781167 RepID=A0A4Z0BNX4_9BURK|nr:4-hydroxythreonine-4-phosphate dehydrogenase PdxA [Ramlibacter rhizophilus]TFY99638.1 4-hydroxythreonine-4-phosphate dehydrogenase PdxA [Ramlibacter rhizophilus]